MREINDEQRDLLRLWIDALRSGEFEQGQRYLHGIDNDVYCCLGVLCEIQKPATQEFNFVEEFPTTRGTSKIYHWGYNAGLSLGDTAAYAEMNDNGDDFARIADRIEDDFFGPTGTY